MASTLVSSPTAMSLAYRRRSGASSASPSVRAGGAGAGAGRAKSMTDLRFLENMGDLQGHLDHMRHSNQLVTCDAEASKVTQGALATQIALKQSEANVVLRDTRRAEKTALALTRQLDAKQKRLDAQQVEMHGAELRNNQLQTTCVDAIANIESLNDQVAEAKEQYARAAHDACAAKAVISQARSVISALSNTQETTTKNLRGAERQLAVKAEAFRVQLRSLKKREKELEENIQRVEERTRAEVAREQETKVAETEKLAAVEGEKEALLDRIGEVLDTIKDRMGQLTDKEESSAQLLPRLEELKDQVHEATHQLHEATRRENDATTRLGLLEQRLAAAEAAEEAAQAQAEALEQRSEELDDAQSQIAEELRRVELELQLRQTEARAAREAEKNSKNELDRLHRQVALAEHEARQLGILRESKSAELGLECEDVHSTASDVKKLENRRDGQKDDQAFHEERIQALESEEQGATASNLELSERLSRLQLEKTREERSNANEILRLQFDVEQQQANAEKAARRVDQLQRHNGELLQVHSVLTAEAAAQHRVLFEKAKALEQVVDQLKDTIKDKTAALEAMHNQARKLDDERRDLELRTQRAIQRGMTEARERQSVQGETEIALVASSGRAANSGSQLQAVADEAGVLSTECDAMRAEIDTKVHKIGELATSMENMHAQLDAHKLQQVEQAQAIRSLRASLKLGLAELEVRRQKVSVTRGHVAEVTAKQKADELYLEDLQQLASDKFDDHIEAIEERAASQALLATSQAEKEQDLMKMSSAAAAVKNMILRIEAMRSELADALEGQRQTREELRQNIAQQELEARLQAEAFNAESAKTVQTALSVEEQVDENELAVQYLGKQAERERTRSQAAVAAKEDAAQQTQKSEALLGVAAEELRTARQQLDNPTRDIILATEEDEIRAADTKILELKLQAETFDAAEGKYQPETDALEDTNQDLRDEIANRRAAALNLKEALLEVQRQFERVRPASTVEELKAQLEQSQAQQEELAARLASMFDDQTETLLESQQNLADVRDNPAHTYPAL